MARTKKRKAIKKVFNRGNKPRKKKPLKALAKEPKKMNYPERKKNKAIVLGAVPPTPNVTNLSKIPTSIQNIREHHIGPEKFILATALRKFIRKIMKELHPGLKMEPKTYDLLQSASETYMVNLFSDAYLVCKHRKSKTVTKSDLQTAYRYSTALPEFRDDFKTRTWTDTGQKEIDNYARYGARYQDDTQWTQDIPEPESPEFDLEFKPRRARLKKRRVQKPKKTDKTTATT